MKKEKLSLRNVKNVLSRADMKNIMAGSGGTGGGGNCSTRDFAPPVSVHCLDSTGFTLGNVLTNYCNASSCSLTLCRASFPTTASVSGGPC